MAYDHLLAARVRELVQGEPGLREKAMFGGLAFLLHGNMAVGASGQGGLLLRIDPADGPALLAQEHVRHFEMRGREMNGWLQVDAAAVVSDEALAHFVGHGVSYAGSLPPK